MKEKIFCGDCMYVSPSEKLQTNNKEPHTCQFYNRRLKHYNTHPELVRLRSCINNRTKEFLLEKKCV